MKIKDIRLELAAPDGSYAVVTKTAGSLMWHWHVKFSDGSGDRFGYQPTKLGAMREARAELRFQCYGISVPHKDFEQRKWKTKVS